MHAYTPETIAAQVDVMRAQIRKNGECVVGCDELRILCEGVVSEKDKARGIAQIAAWENWKFENLPNGSVRFTGATD